MKRLLIVLALVMIAACDKKRGMETRTFELSRLTNDQAIALVTPYIQEGGYLSGKDRLITVRDKPDRLKLIEDLLKKYDGGGQAVDVELDIQVVEADGFTQRDSAIADIEQTLRETFKYTGYRLLGQMHVRTREDSEFEQSQEQFGLRGRVGRVQDVGNTKQVPLDIHFGTPPIRTETGVRAGPGMASTVTVTMGKPLVLGQSTTKGAIILVIRPSIARI